MEEIRKVAYNGFVKISLIVKPNSRRESVELLADGSYQVRVKAPPIEGRANEAVVNLLARCFSVQKSAITILKGATGKRKLVEIDQKETIRSHPAIRS